MKEFLKQNGPYIEGKKDQTFHYLIEILTVMIGYRLLKEGILPYINGDVTFLEMFLPLLLVLATILLSYGCYYIGEHYIVAREYQEEECLIDGILLGLLLPIHSPVIVIVISVFMTIIVGRYFYSGKPFFSPILVGLVTSIGFSIWLSLCDIISSFELRVLFEYTEVIHLNEISLFSIWTGFVGEWISKTSPILCIIALIFLLFKKVLKWRIPAYFIISYFLLLLFSNLFFSMSFIEIFKYLGSSNLLFLAIFVATDQRTTPVTYSGQILFASFLAIFTYIGSYFLTPFLSMMISMLLLNVMVPIFDYIGNYYQLKYCNEF